MAKNLDCMTSSIQYKPARITSPSEESASNARWHITEGGTGYEVLILHTK